MKTTKSFSAEQMPLQPVFLEMEEEEGDVRKATASPAAGQPRQQSPSGSLRGQLRMEVLPWKSLRLQPPCLLSVAAAGGGVRRRCDSSAF